MLEAPSLVFLITSMILVITPGQDMVLVMSRSIALGSRAGIITAAGVSVGLMGHTILVGLGMGAIVQASAGLFTIMKLLGAMYLIYLGIRAFRAPVINFETEQNNDETLAKLFVQGALSNLSNPKILVFYFAFLPQFVAKEAANPTLTLLLLGTTFAILTFIVKAPIGFAAGALSGWMRARPSIQVWLNRFSGSVLIGLGLRLAFEEQAG